MLVELGEGGEVDVDVDAAAPSGASGYPSRRSRRTSARSWSMVRVSVGERRLLASDWINEQVAARFQEVREVLICLDFPLSVAGNTLRRVIRDEYVEGP